MSIHISICFFICTSRLKYVKILSKLIKDNISPLIYIAEKKEEYLMKQTQDRVFVDSVEKLELALARVKEAQRKFADYSQEEVDRIFLAAASAANKARIPLAKQAVAETGMGIVEDKVIKNHYAAEYIYNAYKDVKTCGVLEEDKAFGIKKIAEPVGVIAAVIPTTNPTSTAKYKTLIALKTRNGIVISPIQGQRTAQ